MQTIPAKAEAYAENAATLAEAIRAGDTSTQRAMLPKLSEIEFAELAKLSGCDAFMGAGGSDNYLVIDWKCGAESAQADLARTTIMIFDQHGDVFGFSINPAMRDLAPTAVAQKSDDLPEPRALLRKVAKAVVNGEDARLGGIVPIDDFTIARLSQFEDGAFRMVRRQYKGQVDVFMMTGKGRSSPKQRVTMALDDEGRPTALVFAPTYGVDDPSRYHDNGRGFDINGVSTAYRAVSVSASH